MSTWSNSQQVCCTCRYWNGSRDIDFTATFFTANESQGLCSGPNGSFRMVKTNEGSYCCKWEAFRDK